jgi:hypothetical protein
VAGKLRRNGEEKKTSKKKYSKLQKTLINHEKRNYFTNEIMPTCSKDGRNGNRKFKCSFKGK